MKVVVTGGAGFIGSHFVSLMIEKGHEVIVYDKLTYAALEVIKQNPMFASLAPRITQYGDMPRPFTGGELYEVDINNFDLVLRLLKRHQPDAIVNFAAESHVDRSINNPFPFQRTNVQGTLNLLEATKQLGIDRYVQISTDEVYGTIKDGSFYEGSSLNPRSPYAASKAAADHFVMSYVTTFGLNASITRSSNNFGPYQHVEKFLPHMITNVMRGEKIPVYGDGTNVRDWLFVGDNCRAIENVLHFGKSGHVYNIGGEHELTNLALVNEVVTRMGKNPDEFVEFVEDRPGHDFRYSVNCAKLRLEIGWDRDVGFERGLEITLDHYMGTA